MPKKIILMSFFIIFFYNIAFSSNNIKQSFSLNNVSLYETIDIVENKYKYKINYKGQNSGKRISIVINDLTLNQCLKKILIDFEIFNWTISTNELRREISLRTLNSNKLIRDNHSTQILANETHNDNEFSNFTKEDLYFLREYTESEKQKEQKSNKKLTFEEIYILEKNNNIDSKINYSEASTLTHSEIEQLSKEKVPIEVDNEFSQSEIELIKKDAIKLQNNIETIITDKEIKMLQK